MRGANSGVAGNGLTGWAPTAAAWLFAGLALTTTAVEGVNFAMAGFFVLAAVLGYLGALPLFGIPAGFSADVLLLVVLGVVSLLFAGLVPARR